MDCGVYITLNLTNHNVASMTYVDASSKHYTLQLPPKSIPTDPTAFGFPYLGAGLSHNNKPGFWTVVRNCCMWLFESYE
jgi:hypothetical protein